MAVRKFEALGKPVLVSDMFVIKLVVFVPFSHGQLPEAGCEIQIDRMMGDDERGRDT